MEMPCRVLIVGSGAIKIAEAAEFDYSGSQALKALREEGIETILVNPNVATIQTSHELADKVYLAPLKPEFVEKIIEEERPDSIMLGFGGQTSLSLGVALHRRDVLEKYSVRVLGTPIEGVEKALNRDLFRKTMMESGIPVPPSMVASSVEEAIEAADRIGYPIIVRVSFNLGGRGSIIAWSRRDLERDLLRAFAHSEISLLLVEKYLHHWKEIEFEVVRDMWGNSVAVACLENVEPMGVHTGESIVVAPCQTLTNREYQVLRSASISVADAIDIIGECNVQLALDGSSEKFYVIETNPRMSRSSALASKATGYPLAYIAAKLALGYRLDELLNKVTGLTCACFEPSLDYVVVKMPRWDLDKFHGVEREINSEMKSIGEVMAIGRNLHEAFQKAVRMLDIDEPGLVAGQYYEKHDVLEDVLEKLRRLEPYWPLHAAKAIKLGASVDEIHRLTGVDKFFINIIKDVVSLAEELRNTTPTDPDLPKIISEAKEKGFSDEQLASLLKLPAEKIRELRVKHRIKPYVKQIDTLAAEWPAKTNYLYVTYSAQEHDVPGKIDPRPGLLVVGAGVFRIGVSVEFDWCVVNFANAARKRGYEVIVLNYNPETVSTDWDANEKLYFDEITIERVLDIFSHEKPEGVVAFVGGQLANNLAKKLEDSGIRLLGTCGRSIDVAEDRAKFSELLEKLGIKQPPWTIAESIREALRFSEDVGYPVIVRPSYVLSGTAMKVAYTPRELTHYLTIATKVSSDHPVVVSKFMDDALEAEIDAVSDSRRVVGVTIEHVERAGVHSGDSTMVTPPRKLNTSTIRMMHEAALRIALELGVKGPFNIQFIVKNGEAYVIELNLRASRSMPFSSKSRGVNLMELAAQAVLDNRLRLGVDCDYFEIPPSVWAVKTPQFSWPQLKGSYPHLGPEMRSTGEVACINEIYEIALINSWLSATPNRIPMKSKSILVYTGKREDREMMSDTAYYLDAGGYDVITLAGAQVNGVEEVSGSEIIEMMRMGLVDLVITSGFTPELDYNIRRTAVDLNIPIVLSPELARELSKAIISLEDHSEILEIRELSEYWSKKIPICSLATIGNRANLSD